MGFVGLVELSRKASSPLPVMSYELLVVLTLCVKPFVLRREPCSEPLLLPLVLLLFDCPPLIGDAIRLLIASVGSTEKLSPKPLSSSEFGVVFELWRKGNVSEISSAPVLYHSPIVIFIVARSRIDEVSVSWIIIIWRSHTVHSIRFLVVTDSGLFRCRLEIRGVVDQIAAVDVVVQTGCRLRWGTLHSWRWWTIMLTIWTLTRCRWRAAIAREWRCKVLWFAPVKEDSSFRSHL